MQGNAVKWFALVRTLIASTLFMGLFTWFVPLRLVEPHAFITTTSALKYLGFALIAVGLSVGATSALSFPIKGEGTPAPFDPPRKLVTATVYRHSRNPMYLGLFVIMLGEVVLFKSWRIAALLAGYAAIINLAVLFYEEPALRKKFGPAYEEYCASVRRWI